MNAPTKLAQAIADDVGTSSEFGRLLQRPFTSRDLLEDQNFDKIWRMAEALSNSSLSIPKELKGNIGDCMAIVTQAMIWGLNPFSVAQKAHVINGKLGYEAQLVNAVVMQSGAIRGSFHYEHDGDRCRVGAVLRGDSAITWGEWLSAATVQTKNSPLWKVNPKQQIGYLQVKNWARAFAPGAILGIYSTDELEDFRGGFDSPVTTSITRAAEVYPTLPPYAAEAFEKNLPAWQKLVAEGKKTAPDLLATLRTKATFSDEQQARILALKRAAPPPVPIVIDAEHADFVAALDAAEGAA